MIGPKRWRRWVALGALATAQLMIAIDALIMLVSLPVLQKDLDIAQADGQWVVTIYALPFGALLLLGGRLGDYSGRKRAFIIGWGGFIAASAFGGAAQTAEMLFVARAAQGASAALLVPAALATISITFVEEKERARAFAIYGAVAGIGLALGMILGGVITEYASWRWCLLVNVPVGVVAFVVAVFFLDESRLAGRPRYDVAGTVTAGGGLGGLVYGFVNAAEHGWTTPRTVIVLSGAILLLVCFGLIERRVTDPLLPVPLLNRMRVGAALGMGLLFAGIYAGFLYLIYYLELVKSYSVLEAGFALLPYALGGMLASLALEQRLGRAHPRLPIVAGVMLAAGSMAIVSRADAAWGYWTHLSIPLFLTGVGVLVAFIALTTAILNDTDDNDTGVVSAVLNAALQVGSALGPAIVTPIAIELTDQSADGGLPDAADLTYGFDGAILVAAGLTALGALLVMALLPRRPHASLAIPDELPLTLAVPRSSTCVTTTYTTQRTPDGRSVRIRSVTTTLTTVESFVEVVTDDSACAARPVPD